MEDNYYYDLAEYQIANMADNEDQDQGYINYEIFARNDTGGSAFSSSGTNYTVLRGMGALISRIGFLMIQVGSIPVENVNLIIMYNLIEITLAVISYCIIGFMISFGVYDGAGIVGYGKPTANFADVDQAVLGFAACLIGTAQISTYYIGRIHMVAALANTFFYCAFYQPFLMHWIWFSGGWMSQFLLLGERVSVKDYAGDLVVHISSTIFGLMGAVFLGRRLIRMRNMDDFSIDRNMLIGTLTGYFLIIIGYVLFSLPTPIYEEMRQPKPFAGIIVVNSIVAIVTGSATVILLHVIFLPEIFKYWTILRCIQGGIAALISVAAGIDIYSPFVVAIVSLFGSIFFFFFAVLIHNTSIEDCCNLTSSHLVCGFLGTLACPLLTQDEKLGESVSMRFRGIHFLWQFICLLPVLGLSTFFSLVLFLTFHYSHLLRNRYEIVDHRMATIVEYNIAQRSFFERLFMIDDDTPHIEPGSCRNKSVMILERDRHSPRQKTLKFAR